jgi:hypothetical protein
VTGCGASSGTIFAPFVNVGTALFATIPVQLTNHVKYCSTVKAVNHVNMLTTVTSSGVTIDTTPPPVGKLFDGAFWFQQSFSANTTTLAASWTGFADPDSPTTYTIGFGYTPGSTSLTNGFVAVPGSGAQTFFTLSVSQAVTLGHMVYATLIAKNGADLTTQVYSKGVLYTIQPPVAGVIHYGPRPGGSDTYATTAGQITLNLVNWHGGQSPLKRFFVYLGTSSEFAITFVKLYE